MGPTGGNMKTVFNNRELAHVWAGQKQESGRGSNMFFQGPSIYSYGRHFEIARVMIDAPGVVLFTSASYSNSTAKHKNHVWRAVTHMTMFTVPSMTDHSENVLAYLAAVEKARAAALAAVKYGPMHKETAERNADTAARYVEVFKKYIPVKLRNEVKRTAALVKANKLFTAGELAKIAASDERRRVADEKAIARRAQQAAEWTAGEPARAMDRAHREAKEEDARLCAPANLAAWAAGRDVDTDTYHMRDLPTRLRLKDGRIETSRGAQITERTARALWAGLCRGADIKGMVLDHYTVTSWDGAALVVGCHNIPRAELENMARALGLPGGLPAAVVAVS